METYRVDHNGSVADPKALPRYVFGKARPRMRDWPTFIINSEADSSLEIKVHTVAKAGAVLECFVDGGSTQQFAFPASDNVSYFDQVCRFSIPAGKHEIQLRNTGQDFVHIYWYRFQGQFLDTE